MENKRLYSPAKIKEIMTEFDFRTSKSLGQNFLADGNIVRKIADSADLGAESVVLEIGPGIGTLTEELSERCKTVIAVELDSKLIPVLNRTLEGRDNVVVVNEDVLKLDFDKLKEDYFPKDKIKVVANLPYYITTPILTKLVLKSDMIESISVLIQKEVARRMSANPGGKDYGSLSVYIRYYSEPENLFTVPKSVFIPKPKVDSEVLRLVIKNELEKVGDKFFEIVRAAFSMRRKTLVNCLINSDLGYEQEEVTDALKSLGISENIRGEALGISEFIKLSLILEKP